MSTEDESVKESTNGETSKTPLPVSRMTITFLAPGASDFNYSTENITPTQIGALISWLKWYVNHLYDVHDAARAASAPRLLVPGAMPKHKM